MDIDQLREHIMSCKIQEDQGHWLSKDPMGSMDSFGFIYCVLHKSKKKLYIGKKNYQIGGRKTKTVKGRRVKNTRFGADTGWRKYSTSSQEIKAVLAEDGMGDFGFYHLYDFKTKGGLHYAESNLHHKLNVLTARVHDDERLFYNKAIGATRYIPKEYI